MVRKESVVGKMFSVFGWAIFRGIACVVSLVFKIGPKKDRVRVIIYRDDGDILLIKNRFSRQEWALPGGCVNRNESPQLLPRGQFRLIGVVSLLDREFLGCRESTSEE